jgi:hypothetical protein
VREQYRQRNQLAPGGGDADVALNLPDPLTNIPNIAVSSLSLAPGVTATKSTDRGNSFFTPPNVVAALTPGDDRQWQDAIDSSTVYLSYHDAATFNIDVQRSNDGGLTYVSGAGEAIDANTLPAVNSSGSENIASQIHIDHSNCKSRGNVYEMFVGPDSATENVNDGPLRTAYIGVSTDAKLGAPTFTLPITRFTPAPPARLGPRMASPKSFQPWR